MRVDQPLPVNDLVCLGFSHRSSCFGLLNKISLLSYEIVPFLQELMDEGIAEQAICLATCNRLEFYALSSKTKQFPKSVLGKLAERKGVDYGALKHGSFFSTQDAAMEHLFNVACGLDSLVVGEYEILGQLTNSITKGIDANSIGTELNSIINLALSVGREARTRTLISQGHLSVSSEAISLVEKRLGTLENKTALVVGTGEVGSDTAKSLTERGVQALLIGNRTDEKASQLAQELGCAAISYESMVNQLRNIDIVIVATGAPHYVINPDMLTNAMGENQQMVLVDLSVPRNIDPAVAGLSGVELLTLSSLEERAQKNRDQRYAEIQRVREIIENKLSNIQKAAVTAESTKITSVFRKTIEEKRSSYLKNHSKRFPEKYHDQLEVFSRSLVTNILHDLTLSLSSIDPSTEDGQRKLELAKELLALEAAHDSDLLKETK